MNNTTRVQRKRQGSEKKKARKVLVFNQNFQPQKHLVKEDMVIPWNLTIGMPVYLMIPQIQPQEELLHGMARDILHGWHQDLWTLPTIRHTLFWILAAHGQLDQERQSEGSRHMRCITAFTTEFCRCTKSFVFANSETESCWENCIIHFPTTPPCSTRVDVHETGNVPILFSFSDEKIGKDCWVGPEKGQNYMSCFWLVLFSSWTSTMGHMVLDLTILA